MIPLFCMTVKQQQQQQRQNSLCTTDMIFQILLVSLQWNWMVIVDHLQNIVVHRILQEAFGKVESTL